VELDMCNFLKVGFLVFSGLFVSSSASSDQMIYSHQFDQGVSYPLGTTQYDDWLSFRESLPASDVTSIAVSGSLDSVGRTCGDPLKTQEIVDAMFVGTAGQTSGPSGTLTLSVDCDGYAWNTGSCSTLYTDTNNLELNVGPLVSMCVCSTANYTLRPGVTGGGESSSNWGGIAGATCGASTQTMMVAVNFINSTDSDGDSVLDADDLCPDTAPDDPVDTTGCSEAQVNANGGGVPDADDPQTVMVNGCDSGVANDVLDSGFTIADLMTDAFNLGGEDAVEDALDALKADGILSKDEARAIECCADDDDDDDADDNDDKSQVRKRGHKHGHKHARR
jgi:hypothetical protein